MRHITLFIRRVRIFSLLVNRHKREEKRWVGGVLLTNLQSGLYIPKRHIFLGRCQSNSGPLTPQNSHAIGLLILQWTLENLHVKPRSKWDNLRVFKYGTSGVGGNNRLPRVVIITPSQNQGPYLFHSDEDGPWFDRLPRTAQRPSLLPSIFPGFP